MKTENKIALSSAEGIILGIACTIDKDSDVRTVLESVAKLIRNIINDEEKIVNIE